MDETNATVDQRAPGLLIVIIAVLALEGLALATINLTAPRASTLYWGLAAFDVVLVAGLLARIEAARMVVQALVAVGAIASILALVGGDMLAIFGLCVRAGLFWAIGSAPMRRWTAEPEMPRHFSDVVVRRRRRE